MPDPKFKYLLPTGAILFSFAIISCQKEKTADDHNDPVITVHSPLTGDQFDYQDTVHLSANITDESEIQDVTVSIITPTDTVEFWPPEVVIFGNVTSYELNDDIINGIAVGSPTDVTMRFSATDKHNNSAFTDITIQLK